MCLYMDDNDGAMFLREGRQRARKEHRCNECGRTIELGERYHVWVGVDGGSVDTWKTCAHCEAVIDLGVALTGCPRQWNGGMIYDLDPEVGFVGNILYDEGHNLSEDAGERMMETVACARNGWRDGSGSLLRIPTIDVDPLYVPAAVKVEPFLPAGGIR